MLDEFAGNNTKEVIRALNETIQKQQAEIESLKKEAALQRLSDFTQQAEIEALKNRNWNLVSETWGFDRQPTGQKEKYKRESKNSTNSNKRKGKEQRKGTGIRYKSDLKIHWIFSWKWRSH